MAKFTDQQWTTIHNLLDNNETLYGLPEARSNSLIFSSFNIRKFGAYQSRNKVKRTAGSWRLLIRYAERCDLLAIQEVGDDLTSVKHLIEELGDDYAFIASDVSGGSPGRGGNIERLVFVYKKSVLRTTGLGSDLAYERSDILRTLYENRELFDKDFDERDADLLKLKNDTQAWEAELAIWEQTGFNAQGKKKKPKKPSAPAFSISEFLQFIRTPHMASFQTISTNGEKPYQFIAVNAHLLYGGDTKVWKGERLREFKALMDWLIIRAHKMERMFEPNFILFGDLNLDFEKTNIKREEISAYIKSLNSSNLKKAAKINMPFLDVHPDQQDVFRTNARRNQTFDQIAIVASDREYPPPNQNDNAGKEDDRFDFGMFDFTQLFFDAAPESTIDKSKRTRYSAFEFDVSDHMPIWIRLQKPVVDQHKFIWR